MEEDNQEKFEIRDLRDKNRFVVDDKFLNGYARFLGIYCVGVYNSLCRHANKTQKSWPSIKRIAQELDVGRNKVIESIKYLEFWRIIKKERLGLKLTNRYSLLSKRCWKSLEEANLKEFSEVYHINFGGLQDKLQEFTTQTSIVRKHNSKEIQKKGDSSKKKPYFKGQQMRFSRNKWWVLPNDGGAWLEFAGLEKDIEWKEKP